MFPQYSDKTDMMNIQNDIRRLALKKLDLIISGDNKIEEDIIAIESHLLDLMKPNVFDGSDINSIEYKLHKSYENSLIAVSEHLPSTKLDRLTVFEYYSRIDYLKKKAKEVSLNR